MRRRDAAAIAALPFFAASGAQKIRREAIEWCEVWIPGSDKSDLPRAVLIGDSIVRGCYSGVEQNLKGKAYLARITTSKAVGDPALLSQLRTFLAEIRFDVVHFNIGMHGWAYSEEEYRKGLPDLLSAIRRGAPRAKLIWAGTTPVRKDHEPGPTNQRIEARNLAAREYFSRHGIPIDDLHALMKPHPDLHSDDVHFNAAGNKLLAGQVAREIEKALA